MDYGEFWILESAIEMFVPLRFIDGPRDYLEGQWNKPWHGLGRSSLLDLLERLQAVGDIVIYDENDRLTRLSRQELDHEIDSGQQGPSAKDYRLTGKGGDRWKMSLV